MSSRPSVLIIGGGPSGLVLAHALARRNTLDVTVVERDPNPFECPTTTDRSYTIDITGHGLKAIRYIECVEALDEHLIRFRGVRALRPLRRDVPWEEKGWTGSRGDILRVLLSTLEARYPGRIAFRWETEVDRLDAVRGEVQIGDALESFDWVVGCDGAGSLTRGALEQGIPDFTTEKVSLPNYCTMIALDRDTGDLDPEFLYVMNAHPFTVAGAVNGRDKSDPQWFCMVGFNHEHRFGSDCCKAAAGEPVDAAKQYLERHTDMLPYVSEAELERFVERQCHHIGKAVKCSALHGGKTVMLGDAASAFPPIGQGVNAAMESAMVLDQAIEACGGGHRAEQLLEAAELYTTRWKPEVDAALWIATRWTFSNVRMSAKMMVAELLGRNVLSQAKHMEYSEVYRQAQKRLAMLGPLSRLMEPTPQDTSG